MRHAFTHTIQGSKFKEQITKETKDFTLNIKMTANRNYVPPAAIIVLRVIQQVKYIKNYASERHVVSWSVFLFVHHKDKNINKHYLTASSDNLVMWEKPREKDKM